MHISLIEAQNFRSYDHFTLDLDKHNLGLSLMSAKNGSGKSSVLYALVYALYGQTPSGDKGNSVIKDDQGKNTFARIAFTHGNHKYRITRFRKDSRFHNKVIFERDGKDVTLSTNKETDKSIIETLGFGYDTLLNSVVFSPERLNTFINSTDKNRKQILEELTNTNIYKQAQALVKIDRKGNEEQFQAEQKEFNHLQELANAQKTIYITWQNSVKHNKEHIESLTKQINSLKNISKVDYSKQKQVNLVKISKLQTLITPIKDLTAEQNKVSQLSQQVNSLKVKSNTTKQQLLKDMATFKRIKTGQQNVCELCGTTLTDQHKVIELTNLAKRIKAQISAYKQFNSELDNYIQRLSEARKTLANAQKRNNKIVPLNDKVQKIINALRDQNNQYHSKETVTKMQLDQLRNYQAELKKAKSDTIEKPKELGIDYQKQIDTSSQRLDVLQKQAKHLDQLNQVYSDKGVKAQALSLVIPYLNQKLSKYIQELSNHTMNAYLSSTTKTKTGKVNEQISLNVDSNVSGDEYAELSSGEKQRIGIALNLSFMNYLADQIGGINLCFFDEIFDHLDKEADEAVLSILSELKHEISNIIVISHTDDLVYNDHFDSHLTVQKVDNTSTLSYNS